MCKEIDKELKCDLAKQMENLKPEQGAATLLIPLNVRKQLNEVSDEIITNINIQYFSELNGCLIKTLKDRGVEQGVGAR